MNNRKLVVAAVASIGLTACGPQSNDSNDTDNSSTNNQSTNNQSTNNQSTNNQSTNNQSTNNQSTNNQSTNNQQAQPSITGLAVTADFGTMESAWHIVTFHEGATDLQSTSFGSGDVAVSTGDEWVYAIDRNEARVQVLDAAGLADAGMIEIPGGMPNPQFATDAGGKVYVSLYNEAQIAVATPVGADWSVQLLDTAQFDSVDDNPEASAITADEGYVLVVLQRLENFAGIANSQLLVIDSADDSFVDFDDAVADVQPLDLGGTNAQANLRWMPGGDLAVGLTGDFGALDGGIMTVDRIAAGDYQLGEMLVTEAELGGDLLDFVLLSDTSGIAAISLPDFSSKLVKFDISANSAAVADVETFEDPGLAGLAVSPDGDYWVAGDRAEGAGFALVSSQDDSFEKITTAMTALPPAGIVLVESVE